MSEGANVTVSTGGIALPPPPAPPPPRRKRRWLAAILIFFVFVAGMMVGSGLTIAVAVHKLRYAIHHPEEVPARITAVLSRRLSLSRDQALTVEGLIAKRQSRFQEIRREVQPQVQIELDGLREEIAGVLTSEQREKWERLYSESVRTWLPPAPTGVQ
jgi:hypothetical protein